jgi:hypothetical protein
VLRALAARPIDVRGSEAAVTTSSRRESESRNDRPSNPDADRRSWAKGALSSPATPRFLLRQTFRQPDLRPTTCSLRTSRSSRSRQLLCSDARLPRVVRITGELRPWRPASTSLLCQQRAATLHRCCSSIPAATRCRRRWLLRHATDSQVRLQVAAHRVASKHFGDSCSRGKAGPLSRRSRRWDRRPPGDVHPWRIAGLMRYPSLKTCFGRARLLSSSASVHNRRRLPTSTDAPSGWLLVP